MAVSYTHLVLLEIRPGQSRIDISASLAAEPLIVEV